MRACVQASQFSRLPDSLLTRVLQFLSQRERLTSCAAVCTAWAAAATAATVDIDLSDAPMKVTSAFRPWLEQHSSQLASIRLIMNGHNDYQIQRHKFELPLGQLQQLSRLDLAGLELQLGTRMAGSSGTGTAPTSVKELKLRDCHLGRFTLLQLAQLSGITRLQLQGLPACNNLQYCCLDSKLVKHLVQGLPNLAHLSLARAGPTTDIISVLPASSLTALSFGHVRGGVPELPDSASRLVHLQKLKLAYAQISPVALASMPLLTHLQLFNCEMLPHEPSTSGVDDSTFLGAVGAMRQLQHLLLVGDLDPMELGRAEPCECAALTASSCLTHLKILAGEAQPLPATAAQHMFHVGKELPQLQQLPLCCDKKDLATAGGTAITTAELQGIFSACPALRSLGIVGVLAADVDASVLLELPSTCRSLAVGGQAFGDKAAGVIAQLTQLTYLRWENSPGLTTAGLQWMTTLWLLQTLCLQGNDRLTVISAAFFYEEYNIKYQQLQLEAGSKVRHKRIGQTAA